jgi:hypothetical protein
MKEKLQPLKVHEKVTATFKNSQTRLKFSDLEGDDAEVPTNTEQIPCNEKSSIRFR